MNNEELKAYTYFLIECDCCHDSFRVEDLIVDESGKWVFCQKCSDDESAAMGD